MQSSNSRVNNRPRRHRLRAALACALGAWTIASSGCHRAYYREQADQEAYCIIDEKVRHAEELPPNPLRIALDPRSRMFNPFNPDRPPMPIDDPKSHRYMHCVDGRRGYPLWHANGQTNTAENPEWLQYLPLNEDGVLVLDADTSVKLAFLHSPDYQRQLETLYLSALDVSSERFRFDTQFFGGAQASITGLGEDRSSSNTATTQINVGPSSNGRRDLALQRSFATGADLVVGLANSITWDLAGTNPQAATSILDFSLVQPLLRGAGRDRIMERLTLSERRLLANVRTFERYRRSFYLNITTGRNTEQGVQRSGGVFGVGLGGFTGLGGGFSGLGGGGGGVGGGFVAQAGGFLGLLQDQLQIRNQEENVARLRENLLLLEDTLRLQLTTIPDDQEEIPRQRLQIAQARSALFSANSQLLQARTAFESSVDSFLGDLGLPPYICVKLDDPLLDQFELITEDLKERRDEITSLRFEVGEINTAILNLSQESVNATTGLPERQIAIGPELITQLQALRAQTADVTALRARLLEYDLPAISTDIEHMRSALPERLVQNQRMAEIYEAEKDQICSLLPISTIDPELFDLQEAEQAGEQLVDEHNKLSEQVTLYGDRVETLNQQLDKLIADIQNVLSNSNGEAEPSDLTGRIVDEAILASQNLLSDLSDDILTLQLVQARARTEAVVLPEVDLTPREAFDIAITNRRDIANARASLVDSWRLVEFNADDLESSLDLTFSGDLRNPADSNNPLDFRDSRGSLRVGLQWDAPITRLQERNTYRQSLIEYQQARRNFYQVEDTVWQVLRAQLRQLRANQINFELQRQAVRIAADQITLNEDIRKLRDARGLSSGPTAARDIIFALNDLLSAQNGFLNIWVNYEVIRRGLDLDLGTMELTSEGLWIDPGTISPSTVGSNGGGFGMDGFGFGQMGPGAPCPPEGMVIQAEPIDMAVPMIDDPTFSDPIIAPIPVEALPQARPDAHLSDPEELPFFPGGVQPPQVNSPAPQPETSSRNPFAPKR